MLINSLVDKVIEGYEITKEDATNIYKGKYEDVLAGANRIRTAFCGNEFDLCTIINGKSGRCSEDCKYCAQSSYYKTKISEYPLLSKDKIINSALNSYKKGIKRVSIVTSGKRLNDEEIDLVCESYRELYNKSSILLCASHGLLSVSQFQKLKNSGVSRYHNNIETSKSFFENICSTHTYEDKIIAIRNAQSVGLEVCSGGIIGLGESVEDRIDMAFQLKDLGIKSIPINILTPIKETPFENMVPLSREEILRTIAVFRFINPDAFIRLAGGRAILKDKGKEAINSGANAAISGDMLTTIGNSIEEDIKMIKSSGYEINNG